MVLLVRIARMSFAIRNTIDPPGRPIRMILEHRVLIDAAFGAARPGPMLLRRQGREISRNPLS
jgi:hypothetical protein